MLTSEKKYFKLSPLFSVCLNAFISGIYSGFIHSAISMYIYDKYRNIAKTTLSNAAFYPSDLRMFWLPLLDNFNIGYFNFGVKKNLIIMLDFLIFIFFYYMYSYDFSSFIYLILYIAILGILMAARDSVSIGYKLEFFSKEKIWKYEGKISAWYNLGLCLGGPLIFMFSEYYSWIFLFKILHFLFLINLILNFFIANSKEYKLEKYNSIIDKFKKPYYSLISNKKIFIILILFSITYKIAGRLIVGIIQPFLIETGFSKKNVAIFKIIAGLLTTLIVASTTIISKKFGKKNSILLALILYAIIPILLIFSIFLNNLEFLLYICLLEKILRGVQGNFFFLAQSQCLSGDYEMVQLSILSCIESFIGRTITTFSGHIVEIFKQNQLIISLLPTINIKIIGWLILFILSLLSIMLSLIFTVMFLKTSIIKEHSN